MHLLYRKKLVFNKYSYGNCRASISLIFISSVHIIGYFILQHHTDHSDDLKSMLVKSIAKVDIPTLSRWTQCLSVSLCVWLATETKELHQLFRVFKWISKRTNYQETIAEWCIVDESYAQTTDSEIVLRDILRIALTLAISLLVYQPL